jgi:hypothetical protein
VDGLRAARVLLRGGGRDEVAIEDLVAQLRDEGSNCRSALSN